MNITTPSGSVKAFYAGDDHLSEHVRNHLLVEPECNAWVKAAPAMEAHVADADARWRLAREFQKGIQHAHPLVGAYHAAVQQSADDAKRQRWFATSGATVEVWFSKKGIAAIASRNALLTAYIAGAGTPHQVANAKDRSQPLPRQLSVRGRCRDKLARQCAPQSVRERWDSDQTLFYEVFKPALKHIRRLKHLNPPSNGQSGKNDLAMLCALPHFPKPSMKYEEWSSLQ